MTPFRHEALLYADEVEYLDATVPFVEAGLDAGEPVLVAVPQPRLELLRGALPIDHPRLQLADMEVMGRNPARIIPAWTEFVQALLDEGRSARGIGEPAWAGRSADELAECTWHEALLNLAFGDADGFTLLCLYDASGLPMDVVEDVHVTHQAITGPSGTRTSDAFRSEVDGHLDRPLPPVPERARRTGFAEADYVRLRREVRDAARAAGLSSATVDDAVVAVNEAVVNTVIHGGGSGQLATWSEDGAFVCEIRDTGRITDPLAGRRRPAADQPGGRGLWLMTHLCDLVQIRPRHDGQAIRLRLRSAA